MEVLKIGKAYDLLINKLQGWWEALVLMVPNLVVAILVFVIFLFLAKGSAKLVDKISGKVTEKSTLNDLLSRTVSLLVIGVGLFLTLGILKLDKTVTSLLAGAGILGLALSFAFQDTAANFMAGIFLIIRKPVNVGDIIQSNTHMGRVVEMNLRNTVLKSFQGQFIYVPNKDVYQNAVINYSLLGIRRVDIEIGVSYGDDLEKAKEITLNAVKALEFVNKNNDISLYYKEFGSSSINFVLMFWIDYTEESNFFSARSEAIMSVKKAFDKNGITIPFPIRTLDFGIKGGQKLSSMLKPEVNTLI